MTRAEVVSLIRAELADCESQAAYDDRRVAAVFVVYGPTHPAYGLALVRVQFYRASAAAWRQFARQLTDLLTEMGETP